MDATDLARWTRFAAKGGIGTCTALQDCVAQGVEDLMFLKDDEIVVLLQLPQEDQYLGYCEGVVGHFHGSAVRFHSKLKKPVFAKRQSSTGSSSSRPISLSPRTPSSTSNSPSAVVVAGSGSGSRPISSPTPSPLGVPTITEIRASTSTSTSASRVQSQSTRLSISSASIPLPIQSRASQSLKHNRTPSNTSSVSHYSNHSRPHSRSNESIPALTTRIVSSPAPMPIHSTHIRNFSNASSRSAYSSASTPLSRPSSRTQTHTQSRTHTPNPNQSRPPSRSHSRAGSVSGSEDTHMQLVSIPPPSRPGTLQTAQNTPALTDGSSAHSSFVLSPTSGAFAPPFPQSLGKAPASLFQGRNRSGSDKHIPRTGMETQEGRQRSGSDNLSINSNLNRSVGRETETGWDRRKTPSRVDVQEEAVQETEHVTIRNQEIPTTGLSETSFRSVSVYSVASAEDGLVRNEHGDEEQGGVRNTPAPLRSSLASTNSKISFESSRRSRILKEDDNSDDDDGGVDRALAASPDDLSDGGFGIGMTLLREDDEEDDEENDSDESGRDDEETAVGHAIPMIAHDVEKVPIPATRRLRALGMRVMNPGSVSPSVTGSEHESESESEKEEDVTMVPVLTPGVSTSTSAFTTSSSSGTVSVSHALHPHATSTPDIIAVSPRPPFATHASSSTVTSMSSFSRAATDDEAWESDADIYDDYRYSRYSMHYSGSPAHSQGSSRRYSKASTKSGLSKTSERPPLPDDEPRRKVSTGPSEGATRQKSPSGDSLPANEVVTGSDRTSVLSNSTALELDHRGQNISTSVLTPFTRGSHVPSTSRVVEMRTRTPSPTHVNELTVPVTPATANADMMSLASPLTRAFRHSDDSKYSADSAGIGMDTDGDTDGEQVSEPEPKAAPPLPPLQLPSSRPIVEEQRSPALASSIRDKIQNELTLRAKSPPSQVDKTSSSSGQDEERHHDLAVLTTHVRDEHNIVILNDSPVDQDSEPSRSPSRSLSPADVSSTHLRVASPQAFGSAPPSPLNPGFPPSPSSPTSFPSTPPLSISKHSIPSPSNPRQSFIPPAIPFVGVPPPGRPPAHMEFAQRSQPYQQQQQQHPGQFPPSDSLVSTMRLAGQQRASTIHGRTRTDLLSATGPVPISFLLPGMMPPPSPRPQPAAPSGPYGQVSLGSPPVPSSPLPQAQYSPMSDTQSQTPPRRPFTAPAPAPGAPSMIIPGLNSIPSFPLPPATARANSIQVVPSLSDGDRPAVNKGPPSPLPRANFFPQVGQARPRSRSFSDFSGSDITEKISQSLRKRSQEEGSQPFRASVANNSPRPASPLRVTPLQPAANTQAGPGPGPARGKQGPSPRPMHVPSPLSLPPATNLIHSTPTSPLAIQPVIPNSPITRVAPHPSSMASPEGSGLESQPRRATIRQSPSPLSLRPSPQPTSTLPSPASIIFPPARRNSVQSAKSGPPALEDDQQSLRPPSPLKPQISRQSHDSDRTHSSFNRSEMTSPPPFSNISPSSSPMVRSGSLRSKISITALRSKGAARSIRDGPSDMSSSTADLSTPLADEETVQIKHMEFELVRPSASHASPEMRHGDESPDSKDAISLRMDQLRDSPGVSSEPLSPGGMSTAAERPPGASNTSVDSFLRKNKAADSSTSVQAHRDRELKWVSTINSNDAAQARKSKKIKKLLIEGVPSSVRYLVWAHISNSGSKKMPNVYTQLSKRRPAVAQEIERDVQQCFPDNSQLRDPKGPLVSVLFAYIAMVPDLRYHRGLAIIAGHLLLQSPEEDAFWTFLAMMDSFLRPYFMPTSPQMSIDINLFVKSVETSDPQLATRVFAELKVRPNELCGIWFSSVFAGSLPLEHLHRVWDLFLYEGIPFLFRVGLAILFACRKYLTEPSTNPATVYTGYLLRPPPEVLPTDPEEFIAQVLSIKLKDDDIRKARAKMEAAAKQQRPPRTSTSQPIHPHLQGGGARVRS